MARLTIEDCPYGGVGLNIKRIGGFMDGELKELKSMTNREAEEALIDMLDDRNQGEGTCFACGYGIYGLWFDNEYAYLKIGSSCD